MNDKHKKLLVIQVAGLGYDLLCHWGKKDICGLSIRSADSIFPALTCPVQASFRTASLPGSHGMVHNAVWSDKLYRPLFWEQSARLVCGERIWDKFRKNGAKVGIMFWQQSLGENVDLLLSPAPIHTHGGRMVHDCYCKPAGLYKHLCKQIGRSFRLSQYWGPLASAKVGDWIASATKLVIQDSRIAPDLLLIYLPSLDYDLQRYGPYHIKSRNAVEKTCGQLEKIISSAKDNDYDVVLFGDYAVEQTKAGAIFPNRALLDAGLLSVRKVKKMLYPDFYTTRAFAVADHQIAHVFVRNKEDINKVGSILEQMSGIDKVLDYDAQIKAGIANVNSGQLVLIADSGYWIGYPWWSDNRRCPDYARHIDIHNKPGYDPCELFWGWPPLTVTLNTSRIGGSHGRVDSKSKVAWASTFQLQSEPICLVDLALDIKNWFNKPNGR